MFTKIIQLIPGQILERLYYSRFSSILISIFNYVNKNEELKLHKIFGDILMEIDLSKPSERAIPFNAFEPSITHKFLEILKDGGIVLDVGAWIGYYTILAATKAEKVIAIEADETNCQRIRRNVNVNGFSNVLILNVAVGDKASRGVLMEGPSSSMHKLSPEGKGKNVKVESLDNIINKSKINKINLLIMDVEGYEYFALKGLQASLSSKVIRNIICEIHPDMLDHNGVSSNDVLKILSDCRYQISVFEKSTNFRPYHIHAKLGDR
jgi:FkbM family methyltransferase